MLEFCPDCNNLLRKRIFDGMEYLNNNKLKSIPKTIENLHSLKPTLT